MSGVTTSLTFLFLLPMASGSNPSLNVTLNLATTHTLHPCRVGLPTMHSCFIVLVLIFKTLPSIYSFLKHPVSSLHLPNLSPLFQCPSLIHHEDLSSLSHNIYVYSLIFGALSFLYHTISHHYIHHIQLFLCFLNPWEGFAFSDLYKLFELKDRITLFFIPSPQPAL